MGRAARCELKASPDRALPRPASEVRGLVLRTFEDQRLEVAPEEPLTVWPLYGPLLATSPLWSFLDDPTLEACHLIIFKEFTELVKEFAPDAIVRNSCVILRTVVTARYLQYKIEGLHPADDDASCCF